MPEAKAVMLLVLTVRSWCSKMSWRSNLPDPYQHADVYSSPSAVDTLDGQSVRSLPSTDHSYSTGNTPVYAIGGSSSSNSCCTSPTGFDSCYGEPIATSSMDIQLLNDEQEQAFLGDLCDSVGEATPLSTFSYISEYICSNNIDIWPGEVPSAVAAGCGMTAPQEPPRMASVQAGHAGTGGCVHQQLFVRCKRVLELIVARNEQIISILRQKQRPPNGVQ
uniref:Uncharacterized protein n=1 Tax=Anopheles darlingi TaxID=43151 RepID=A0A2K6VB09_ANODA